MAPPLTADDLERPVRRRADRNPTRPKRTLIGVATRTGWDLRVVPKGGVLAAWRDITRRPDPLTPDGPAFFRFIAARRLNQRLQQEPRVPRALESRL